MYVYAVEEGAGDALLVAGDDRGGAGALLHGVAVVAAGAPIPIALAVLSVYMNVSHMGPW